MATFIQMPTVPYNKMYQRPQQIMRKLSEKGHTVYYIDNVNEDYFIKINENLYEVGVNYKIDVNKLVKPIILWFSSPEQITRIDSIYHDYVIYDIVDDYSHEFAVWNSYVEDMLKKSNIVFVTADALYRKFSKKHNKTYIIKNGLDIDNFPLTKNKIPHDLPRKRRIVGYVGAVATWIDWGLVNYMIRSNYDFVFVGPKYGDVNLNFNKDNIYFLGEKRYEDLPYYISNFSCCIIPFKVNEMTNSCNPIKLYEYMALGKPVVSTGIYEVGKLQDICYISKGKNDFMKNIDRAINGETQQLINSRRKFALNNSWEKRVSNIIQVLEENKLL
ncbi:glycosyltransferase [Clostridium tyrobutyricum]|uniref:Uncharacterized protein n=1 Tax=Clostridium tyrobutyricum TaxID=1519 RepID=A0A0A7HJ41_CLOTY|nr:glycosyltransferase [Clostridium tyrobutyricum]AIZ03675.1 hypothetical protein CTB_02690 [Clostridium tyrobutyricum]MBV4417365.1 glycosyltransferase [Clostridium tyrobutyricum]MBV4422882.1 glycosyltransferase [Clostridium tyrobutyricum]MBV4424904.1 glycosyltransferase [Clostridium tyrobutyricum]MBV4429426.1 glycosyltransferase [Clostridium tyrobutyricum]